MNPLCFFLLFLLPLAALRAEPMLVENGQARAEIIIAEKPERTVRFAAQDLQTYIQKISGAKLPIATRPTSGVPAQVYVGRSAETDRLGITAAGLKEGAYRMVSGDRWLVLIGDDKDFTPIEPWAKNNGEIVSGKTQAEFDKLTGALWGVPNLLMYKHRLTVPGEIGRPEGAVGKAEPWQFWGGDERGSFNAVAGFLHRLGVRWYMPGELGEVVPAMPSISLPKLDETVRPDFALRAFDFRFGVTGLETALWAMRLGTRQPLDGEIAHGLEAMTSRPEIFAAHPDWFALYGGTRAAQPGREFNHQLCYSSEELFQETVRYVRAQFDILHLEAASVMPPDGFSAMCQCPLCTGKDTPERGERGLLSDYVWGFVNRVAHEVGKTHPGKKIINCAYGTYSLPPLKIAQLEPNVVVGLVGGRSPRFNKPEQQAEFQKYRDEWVAKTPNPIFIFENFPFIDRGWYLPVFTAHSYGASANACKGISQGETISLTIMQNFATSGIALNHFMVYFTARSYWGGRGYDADAELREYCRLFYGPAEQEMLAFFNYCEANWQEM